MTVRLPLKSDGRHGTLRYWQADGRKSVVSGRLTWLYAVAAQAAIAGTGRDFEIRLRNGDPWHAIRLTPEQFASALSGGLNGDKLVERARAVRARRVAKGKPVYS